MVIIRNPATSQAMASDTSAHPPSTVNVAHTLLMLKYTTHNKLLYDTHPLKPVQEKHNPCLRDEDWQHKLSRRLVSGVLPATTQSFLLCT